MLKYTPLVLIALIIVGCGGGGGGGTPGPGGTGSGINITISPLSVTLKGGDQVQFAPTVTGTTDTSVTWEVTKPIDGGVVSLTGLYTAPSTPGPSGVKVTSVADPTKTAVAEITVTPGDDNSGGNEGIIVSVTPQEVVLLSGETQQFLATVVGLSSQAVSWDVVEGDSGGTITSTGLYTASAAAGHFYHVRATSQADNSKSGTAIVNVVEFPPFPTP